MNKYKTYFIMCAWTLITFDVGANKFWQVMFTRTAIMHDGHVEMHVM